MTQITRLKILTVQFIHKFIREFLLKENALINLLPGFRGVSEKLSYK